MIRSGYFLRGLIEACAKRIPFYESPAQSLPPPAYRPTRPDTLRSIETFEWILTRNIVPFWYPGIIDREDGGYKLNHDVLGKWKGPANKYLVTQARALWFFSRLAQSAYGGGEHLDAASHGYRFLRERMWDKEFGGFYWEVDSPGSAALRPDKHVCGQAFALYALSQYAVVSADVSATALAGELFDLLELRAHDSRYGGYREFFGRNWISPPTAAPGFLSTPASCKQLNSHLHLLEAFTAYYLLTNDARVRERLIELIFVQSNAVVRKTIGACTDKHERDWLPIRGRRYDRVVYGHDLENIWLLIEACDAAGICNGPLLDLYRTLFGYALRFGFDRNNGGFYETGSFNAPADKRNKIWWVQAEALVSALQMYRLTQEESYFDCFLRTLDWIVKRQIDWENGDWHACVNSNGTPSGDKAGAWKSAYHNGRAVIQCLEALQVLAE